MQARVSSMIHTDSMPAKRRATPCVGICSTTYGDLVCRGCRRFSHEITGWNGYDDEQRERVWERLESLRATAVDAVVRPDSPDLLESFRERLELPEDVSWQETAYDVLCRAPAGKALYELGLASIEHDAVGAARSAIDALTGQLAEAHYERNFRVSLLDTR